MNLHHIYAFSKEWNKIKETKSVGYKLEQKLDRTMIMRLESVCDACLINLIQAGSTFLIDEGNMDGESWFCISQLVGEITMLTIYYSHCFLIYLL